MSAAAAAGRQLGSAYREGAAAVAAGAADEAQAFKGITRTFGEGVDMVQKSWENREISKGAADFATLNDALINKWNDTVKTSDPNDPTLMQKFREEVLEPELGKFKEGFVTEGGSKWAEGHIQQFRTHMFTKTASDMASLAGSAVLSNMERIVNSSSNMVRGDPSSVGYATDALKSSTDALIASSPNLKGATAAKVREEIVQKGTEKIVNAAAMGHIEKTGEMPPWARDPKFSPYIDGADLKRFEQTARMFRHQAAAEQRAQQAQVEHAAKIDFHKELNKLEADMMPSEAGGTPTVPDDGWARLRRLSTHPGAALEPSRIKSVFQQMEAVTNRLNKPEPLGPVSHETTMTLLKQIRGADGFARLDSVDPIYQMYGDGKLNRGDFQFLVTEYNNLRTPDGQKLGQQLNSFFKGIEPMLTGPINQEPDPLGKEKFYSFTFEVERKMAEYRKAGKDPRDLIDPSKPDYMGNIEVLKGYMGPRRERMINRLGRVGGIVPVEGGGAQPGVDLKPPPTITTREEFKKLPSNTKFYGSDGKLYTKP